MKGLHKKLNDILIVFKLPNFSRSCSKRIGNIFQLSQPMIKLPMESFEIFIRKLFIKTLLIKSLVIWKKRKNEIKQILNVCFNMLHLKYSKYKFDNEIFFLILHKYNSTQIQQLQHWYSKCNSKENCLSARASSLLIKTLL